MILYCKAFKLAPGSSRFPFSARMIGLDSCDEERPPMRFQYANPCGACPFFSIIFTPSPSLASSRGLSPRRCMFGHSTQLPIGSFLRFFLFGFIETPPRAETELSYFFFASVPYFGVSLYNPLMLVSPSPCAVGSVTFFF